MKKILLSILTVSCLGYHVSGQIDFGVKAGAGLATVKGIGSGNNKARLGFNGGLMSRISVSPKLILQPELQYSLKGYQFPTQGYNSSGSLSLHYLALPILGGYQPTDRVTLLLGPEFGYLLHAGSHADGANHDISDGFRKFDAGIDVGAAYQIHEGLGVDIRYNYGFKGLTEGVATDPSGAEVGRGKFGSNQVLQLSLFYLFRP